MIENYSVEMEFAAKFSVAEEAYTTTTSDVVDDVLAAVGIETTPPDPDADLWDELIAQASDALEDATDIPLAFDELRRIMLPGVTAASGLVEWVKVEIFAVATGTLYTWSQDGTDPPEWGQPQANQKIKASLYADTETFTLLYDLYDVGDAKDFVEDVESLFSDAATSLTANPVDGKASLVPVANATADKVVFPSGEE